MEEFFIKPVKIVKYITRLLLFSNWDEHWTVDTNLAHLDREMGNGDVDNYC